MDVVPQKFYARIERIGCAATALDDDSWMRVEGASHEYAVRIFPEQDLTRDEQIDFGLRVGDLELADGCESGSARPTDRAIPGPQWGSRSSPTSPT